MVSWTLPWKETGGPGICDNVRPNIKSSKATEVDSEDDFIKIDLGRKDKESFHSQWEHVSLSGAGIFVLPPSKAPKEDDRGRPVGGFAGRLGRDEK